MYEKFTDRARKVMQLANQEAQRFRHEYIGTEHVLLGLVKEGTGIASYALKNLGVDIGRIRRETEKLVPPHSDAVLGKLPQTPTAKKVIEYSIEEARNLNHNYVGTEHLLLGLIREGEGTGAKVLQNLGLELEEVHQEILRLLVGGDEKPKEWPSHRCLVVPAGYKVMPVYNVIKDNVANQVVGDIVEIVAAFPEATLIQLAGHVMVKE